MWAATGSQWSSYQQWADVGPLQVVEDWMLVKVFVYTYSSMCTSVDFTVFLLHISICAHTVNASATIANSGNVSAAQKCDLNL